ncbi:tagaturonate reductase [Fibrella aestuarina BUZ 2]|uniref:Tagaturonate reductase n=1 Tax=Fibrella aestuarina BUZ 2 TaxID=1166018 RepID=I0KC78_9BACT|nr:tagaturonate reductase [Fibrella aestuarina]CCH01731.1 tagaturonate reductase [Fibrella aestuarina BUZ 2]
MHLSADYVLNHPPATAAQRPPAALLQLPEKVLQFGTGALLRGLPDYLIDKANRQGLFNGRIVAVKSTEGGDLAAFRRQDSLYTLCIRGVDQGQLIDETVVCSAISRVLSAKRDWAEILRVAANPDLQLVLSNTTEVGIQLVQDNIRQAPPQSFPGKLLAVLYARYGAFAGDPARGLVIVPTELIPENGTRLEAIVLELAHRNGLEAAFIDWLESANTFCNSLVDRIVPGAPDSATQPQWHARLGYTDALLIITEPYRLWAIELPTESDSEQVRSALSFQAADRGIWVQPDITLFRELKLRLLNGAHTLSCGLAQLAGCQTVRDTMQHQTLAAYVRSLLLAELVPGMPYALDDKLVQRFALDTLDRFQNPYIEHRWLSITLNYSAKMQARVVPTLLHYQARFSTVPRYMALGLAGYLCFTRPLYQHKGVWYGDENGTPYPIQDERAAYFAELWQTTPPEALVLTVLRNRSLWGHDLTQLPGLTDAVTTYLTDLLTAGVTPTVATLFTRPESIPL